MIKLLAEGVYTLSQTRRNTKILTLLGKPKKKFAWVTAGKIGDILVYSTGQDDVMTMLAEGSFRMYEVENEDKLTDLIHLELFVGNGKWQGYLLPTGLPGKADKNRIIPTSELITHPLPTPLHLVHSQADLAS